MWLECLEYAPKMEGEKKCINIFVNKISWKVATCKKTRKTVAGVKDHVYCLWYWKYRTSKFSYQSQ